jgi:PAS domain S-box-containing protein
MIKECIVCDSVAQVAGEASVNAFRNDLGPFVVAAEKTRMPMIFTDAKAGHPILFANDAFLGLTGFTRNEVMGASFQSLLALGVTPEARTLVEAAFRQDVGPEPEIHYRRENGGEFWASLFVSPVCDGAGVIVQYFVSIHDLTEHRREVTHSKMLIDELNHRVKNTIATVQSIVTQALRRPAAPEVIRESIESRLFALSRSHDLLTDSKWDRTDLRQLVRSALQPFEVVVGQAERLTAFGDDVQLSPKATLALAIALHELATNAVKYGAFSNGAGTIGISWRAWGPPVKAPTNKGFGSWVIERGLAHELGGNVSLEYLEEGVICVIDMPYPPQGDV